MSRDQKYVATRQILLDLLQAVQGGGLSAEAIGKLHIDAATDKIQGIWEG